MVIGRPGLAQNVINVLNLITMAANESKAMVAVFLDMAKVFHRVSHSRSLATVKPYGMADPLHSLLAPHLASNSPTVDVNDLCLYTGL